MRYYQSFPTAIPLYGAGYPRVTHPSATQSSLHFDRDLRFGVFVRLACVRHAASVHPEPGSNSQNNSLKALGLFVSLWQQNEAVLHSIRYTSRRYLFDNSWSFSESFSLGRWIITFHLPLKEPSGLHCCLFVMVRRALKIISFCGALIILTSPYLIVNNFFAKITVFFNCLKSCGLLPFYIQNTVCLSTAIRHSDCLTACSFVSNR